MLNLAAMCIQIKEVTTKHELDLFIKFPMKLYKTNPCYVPPFINEEKETLDREKNPVFAHAEAHYFLAYKAQNVVGRIAAIINWDEVNNQGKSKMRFGWFDTIDDLSVTEALLNKVKEIGLAHSLTYMEGPVGFSNLEKAGLLTMGFDQLATMVTLYNDAYYAKHFQQLGFETANEWVEYALDFPSVLPEKVVKFNTIIKVNTLPKCFKVESSAHPTINF